MGGLLKFKDEADGRQRDTELHFGRASLDGMPYRGKPMLLREEEYEELTEVVSDSHVKIFDITNEEQRKEFSEIIDRCISGWYVVHEKQTKMVKQPDGS